MAFGSISQRRRKQYVEQAKSHLPPGAVVRQAGMGWSQARMSNGAAVAIAVFCVVFVVMLAAGYIVLPGGLLGFYVWHSVKPWRVVIVADQGIAVLSKSIVTNKVTGLLATAPLSDFRTDSADDCQQFGDEKLRFSTKEFERLATAVRQVVRSSDVFAA